MRWTHPSFLGQHVGFLDDMRLQAVPHYGSPVVGFSPNAGQMW